MQIDQLCTFYINQYFFGIDVSYVQEIIKHDEITPIPRAPQKVIGLLNLRGQIVTAIDLRQTFNFTEKKSEIKNHNNDDVTYVVLSNENDCAGLIIDTVSDIVEFNENNYEAVPISLSEDIQSYLSGVYKTDEQLMMLLDINKILQ